MPIDALSVLCAQLMRDLLAIAKFLSGPAFLGPAFSTPDIWSHIFCSFIFIGPPFSGHAFSVDAP